MIQYQDNFLINLKRIFEKRANTLIKHCLWIYFVFVCKFIVLGRIMWKDLPFKRRNGGMIQIAVEF